MPWSRLSRKRRFKRGGSLSNSSRHAGTAFDGEHLFQIGNAVIRKIDPQTGEVVAVT